MTPFHFQTPRYAERLTLCLMSDVTPEEGCLSHAAACIPLDTLHSRLDDQNKRGLCRSSQSLFEILPYRMVW